MTTLTNANRKIVLEKVLTEAFQPRFEAIEKDLKKELVAFIKEQHPVFVKAWADEAIRRYMASSHNPYVGHESEYDGWNKRFRSPIYGEAATIPGDHGFVRDNTREINIRDVPAPASSCDLKLPGDHPITKEYHKAWLDYNAAFARLHSLLHSYKSREKFEVDFPEMACHIPTVTKAPLPAVIVKDVRRELAKFGVPPKDAPVKK